MKCQDESLSNFFGVVGGILGHNSERQGRGFQRLFRRKVRVRRVGGRVGEL